MSDTTTANPMQAGMAILQQLQLTKPGSPPPAISQALLQTSVGHLFGTIWSRPALSVPQRSLITLTVLVALNREAELLLHFRGARNVGITKETLEEMILHVAHYAGWPVAVSANRVLNEVWAEMDKEAAGA